MSTSLNISFAFVSVTKSQMCTEQNKEVWEEQKKNTSYNSSRIENHIEWGKTHTECINEITEVLWTPLNIIKWNASLAFGNNIDCNRIELTEQQN